MANLTRALKSTGTKFTTYFTSFFKYGASNCDLTSNDVFILFAGTREDILGWGCCGVHHFLIINNIKSIKLVKPINTLV